MSRVLVSYYSDYGETMYDAICDSLLKNGNDVFRYNINNASITMDEWGGHCRIVDQELLERIKGFKADLVFNFNNSLPEGVEDVLPGTCKICLIDADNPTTFWNKESLLKKTEQYYYLGLQSYSKTMYEKYFHESMIPGKNYLYFPPGTNIVSEKLPQDKNISFIGSNFYPLAIPEGVTFYSKDALELYDLLKGNYFITEKEIAHLFREDDDIPWLLEKVRAYYVGQERLKYMQALTDLGFVFYGVRWWNHIAYYDFELAKCFDPTPKITLEDNQWVYNTSKISINISHPQAKSSFSWRVMDIMASQACLLMEDKQDFKDLFGEYLSKDTLDAIIYKDRYDLRQKAINLLENEELRRKCVTELNNAIEKNGRWECRFRELQSFIGVQLLNTNKAPQYIVIPYGKRKEQTNTQNIDGNSLARKIGRKIIDTIQSVLLKIESGK